MNADTAYTVNLIQKGLTLLTIATDPVSVTMTGTTNATLSAPAVDASTFYRVRAGASKAALSAQ